MSEWIPTPESSNVAGFSYDEVTQVLTVEFNNGSYYDYHDVPEQAFEEMKSADSKGKYLNTAIKGHYRYTKK